MQPWQMALLFGLPAALLAYWYAFLDLRDELRPNYLTLIGCMTVAGLLLAWRNPAPQAEFAYHLLFLALVVTVGVVCWQSWLIPNVLTGPGAALGLLGSVVLAQNAWTESALGCLGCGLPLYLLARWKPEAMGLGCAKLAAMTGAFLGLGAGWAALTLSFMAPLPIVVVRLARGASEKDPFEFGSFMAWSAALVAVFGPDVERLLEQWMK